MAFLSAGEVAHGGAAPPSDEGASGYRCAAYGCPLAGSISASTRGGGPWYCRFHFAVGPSGWAEITTRLTRERASGELTQAPSAPAAVQRIREQIAEVRARRASGQREREPGEDDE